MAVAGITAVVLAFPMNASAQTLAEMQDWLRGIGPDLTLDEVIRVLLNTAIAFAAFKFGKSIR